MRVHRREVDMLRESLIRTAPWFWQQGAWFLLALLALPALWPLLTLGLHFSVDGPIHLARVVMLDHSLRQGVFYPRWMPELFMGRGFPLFNFHAPAVYYLIEALHLAGFDFHQAMVATYVFFLLVAGAGMLLLARDIYGAGQQSAALVAAVAYLYAPYLMANVYGRNSVTTAAALALLPWLFLCFRRLAVRPDPSRWVLPAAGTLGALALTHSLSLLFAAPTLLGYLLVLSSRPGGSTPRRMIWIGSALALAMGLSAFFWLPMVLERHYLSGTPLEAAALFVGGSVWDWHNAINRSFTFGYSPPGPFQLGLVQVTLLLPGIIVAARRGAERVFFVVVLVAGAFLIMRQALPLWLNNDILLAAQFPWRLLGIVSFAIAILTGGVVSLAGRTRLRPLLALGMVLVIIAAQHPRIAPRDARILSSDPNNLSLPRITQYELGTGNWGLTTTQEFKPRWAQSVIPHEAEREVGPGAALQIAVDAAGPGLLRVTISAPAAVDLHLTNFYFPGWTATLDDGREVPLGPSRTMGVRTVSLPPGSYHLTLRWQGTTVQRLAGGLTLLSVALIACYLWRSGGRRVWSLIPGAMCLVGLLVVIAPPRPALPVEAPQEPVAAAGVELLGYRLERAGLSDLYIYPYWYTRDLPPQLHMRWLLTDDEGRIVHETESAPFFNATESRNWPAHALVDDAHHIALPPGLPSGQYRLRLQLVAVEGKARALTGARLVGEVRVASDVPADRRPAYPLDYRFGDQIMLRGFDLTINGKPAVLVNGYPIARPGDRLAYTLYWQALGPIPENYHGFVHLLDVHREPLLQRDQLPGPLFRAPRSWDTSHLQPDRYEFLIPDAAGSGLYRPQVGLYHHAPITRLPVYDSAGRALDGVHLPPVKIVAAQGWRPRTAPLARFEDLATLQDYRLDLPPGGIRPGDSLTLTLTYEARRPAVADYTRFVHLISDRGEMAAQSDGPPAAGGNPTTSWQAGERVTEVVLLTVRPDAHPGRYFLRVGFYDPRRGGERVAVFDPGGARLQGSQVTLVEIEVGR